MGRIRLQVVIALFAIVGLVFAMGYVAFTVTTVMVPDYGGTYIEGVAGNPSLINPILCQSNPIDQDLVALIFTGLTRATEKGEIVPDLAERWEVSPDGTVYTFYLRQDVLWHDGAPFAADDVAFTMHAMQHPDFPGWPYLADLWRTVVVDKVDSHTIRFTLREPFAPFLDYTTIGILPYHVLGNMAIGVLGESKFNAAPIGTGPFKVGEISARRFNLVANPDYYGARPYLDRIGFIFYPNESAVFEARQRGEVAGIARVLPEYLDDVAADDGLTLLSAPISGYNLVVLNLDKGIFQERAVRQALMWALDRQALVDDVLGGQGIVMHSPILPHSWAYDENIRHYSRDLSKSVELLEGADWFDDDGDGIRERGSLKLEFELLTNDDPARMAMAEGISRQLAEVGVAARLEIIPWEELAGQRLRLRQYDAALIAWQDLPPDPDPYPYWHSSQASEDGANFANYISEEADALLEEARLTSDQARRLELYRRFQARFVEDVPSLLLYQPVYNYAVDAGVHDVQLGPMIGSSDRFRTVTSWYMTAERMLYSEAREKGLVAAP
jgi:peptide/nickel transport system substrate-binding protein